MAASRFKCTLRERAVFECGIKMGTIYHQFVGMPVDIDSVSGLEKTMKDAIMVQPYVKDVSIKIDRTVFMKKDDEYSYVSLTGDMIDAKVTVEIDGVSATAEMRFDRELGYPLMYISE